MLLYFDNEVVLILKMPPSAAFMESMLIFPRCAVILGYQEDKGSIDGQGCLMFLPVAAEILLAHKKLR
jgi:hypothetical protein